MSAHIILLDRILARYGTDANGACALSGSSRFAGRLAVLAMRLDLNFPLRRARGPDTRRHWNSITIQRSPDGILLHVQPSTTLFYPPLNRPTKAVYASYETATILRASYYSYRDE